MWPRWTLYLHYLHIVLICGDRRSYHCPLTRERPLIAYRIEWSCSTHCEITQTSDRFDFRPQRCQEKTKRPRSQYVNKTLHICRWHKGMHGVLKYLCWPKEKVVFKSSIVLKVQPSKVWRPLPNSPPHSGGCSTCLMVSSPRRVLAQCGLNTAAEHNWYTGYCQESSVGNLSPEETHTLGCYGPIIRRVKLVK